MVALIALVLPGCGSVDGHHPFHLVIVDGGVAIDLPPIAGYQIWQEATEPTTDHGTMVLSLILGATGVGTNLPSAHLSVSSIDAMRLKADSAADRLALAIELAVAKGADLVSISVGVRHPTPALDRAVQEASTAGVLIVAAAGNVRSLPSDYPARYPSVVSVGAIEPDGGQWVESGRRDLSTSALGVDVPVLRSDGTIAHVSGTSFAAAIVTNHLVAAAVCRDQSILSRKDLAGVDPRRWAVRRPC
jgi:subtilisin family serine protease